MTQHTISSDQAGNRLDVFVAAAMPSLSRAAVQRLCDTSKILVNDAGVKTGYKLKVGDNVTVDYDMRQQHVVPHIDLPVLYEDDDCVVINKPLGVLTHSKGAFNPEATVASWLQPRLAANWPSTTRPDRSRRSDSNEETGRGNEQNARLGIVHRLDRATSGVMICAKTPAALSWLQKQFSLRKVKKTYMAVVQGHLKESEAIIDMPIERNPKRPQTFRVGANGKPAQTAYRVIGESDTLSLLELKPHTGRTHQLRVHLNQLGHPIVGDTLYGGRTADRLYLHAQDLEITLPNRQRMTFEAPLPNSFQAIME